MISLSESRTRALKFQKEWEENFNQAIGLKFI